MSQPSAGFVRGMGLAVSLDEVEPTLARLWGETPGSSGEPVEPSPSEAGEAPAALHAVTRLVLANLVVADLGQSCPGPVEGLLETVAERYPSRILLLVHDPGEPERSVRAEVAALCHLPSPGQPQVCSERIALIASSRSYDLLPGSVRPLLLAELPLVLWWRGEPGPVRQLYADLADEATRIVVDLCDPEAPAGAVREALTLPAAASVGRDLAWFGATVWRELIAQFFDPPGAESALAQIRDVRIEVATAPPASDDRLQRVPRVGLWLAAWLAGQLGWTGRTVRTDGPGRLHAVFQGPDGPIGVDVVTYPDPGAEAPRVVSVRLDAGTGGTFRLRRHDGTGEVAASTDAPGHDALPRILQAPEWETARRLAAAFESARDDPPYRAASPWMLWMLDAQG